MTSWQAISVTSLSNSNPEIPSYNSWSRSHWGGRIIYSVTPAVNCSNFLPSFLPNWAKIPPHKYLDHGSRMSRPIPRDYRDKTLAWVRSRSCGRSGSFLRMRSCDTPPTAPPTPVSACWGRGIKLSAWLAWDGEYVHSENILSISGGREYETCGHHNLHNLLRPRKEKTSLYYWVRE